MPTRFLALESELLVAAGDLGAANNRGPFSTDDADDSWTRFDMSWEQEFTEQTVRGLATLRYPNTKFIDYLSNLFR